MGEGRRGVGEDGAPEGTVEMRHGRGRGAVHCPCA